MIVRVDENGKKQILATVATPADWKANEDQPGYILNKPDLGEGIPGPANVLSIGTVAQGDTASATITGTSPNQSLNLVLPRGANAKIEKFTSATEAMNWSSQLANNNAIAYTTI
jgi:hypothetical protein